MRRRIFASRFGYVGRPPPETPLLWLTARWEERRLARGWTYEPKPIIERR